MSGYTKLSVRLSEMPIDEVNEYAAFSRRYADSGALAAFAGRVRGHADTGEVEALYLDWYPGMTEASLSAIAEAAGVRFDIAALSIIHRCAEVRPGEVIVLVCAAAAHRRAAFEAVDYAMDRLKSEAALWKRETVREGAGVPMQCWVEPTSKDADDLRRWEKT